MPSIPRVRARRCRPEPHKDSGRARSPARVDRCGLSSPPRSPSSPESSLICVEYQIGAFSLAVREVSTGLPAENTQEMEPRSKCETLGIEHVCPVRPRRLAWTDYRPAEPETWVRIPAGASHWGAAVVTTPTPSAKPACSCSHHARRSRSAFFFTFVNLGRLTRQSAPGFQLSASTT